MNTEQSHEIWQVEANGQLFETNFVEMTEWIVDGSLLRQDKVRKGNLRWIEAGKVPSLVAVFNAAESGQPLPPPVITTTKLGPTVVPGSANPPNPTSSAFTASVATAGLAQSSLETICSVHGDVAAVFACETCANNFCRACPSSYGGTVKICPFCGAMCKPIAKAESSPAATYNYPAVGSFGFGDFGEAIGYPFKFMPSLVMGAIMFMFLSVGQTVTAFGGIFMMWGALACWLLSNTLTFGILANTVENFAQGKIGLNFMPSFDDFSIWDDVVHPFFLMIGVYISSFGPLIAVFVLAFFLIVAPVQKELTEVQATSMGNVDRELPYAANAARQSERVRELVNKDKESLSNGVAAIESGDTLQGEQAAPESFRNGGEITEEEIAELQTLIQDHRKAQLESVVGPAPETVANERLALFQQVLARGALLLVAAGLCLLWGLFYFPAACAVAAYTRSFTAAVNPTVGIDTIRRLGLAYVKILFMGLILAIASGLVGGVLAAIFAPFDMPAIGNIPASAIGALFGFYLSVVFACVLGFALYKNAEKLKLYR